ncbi:MAG: ester cyclase [Bacteroidota bacterium]
MKLAKQTIATLVLLITMTVNAQNNETIGRQFYDAFQKGQFEKFDDIVHQDVVTISSGSYQNAQGIEALKTWAKGFLTAFSARIDLVDELATKDRGFVAVNLHWKHVGDFFGMPATGREGTSYEYIIYKIKDGKIAEIRVADLTLSLVTYMKESGFPVRMGMDPKPIVKGVERKK